jgi:hypothetical protein
MADRTVDFHSEIPPLANRLTPEAVAAIEAAGKPEPEAVNLTVENSVMLWECTRELRFVVPATTTTEAPKLQQRWFCRENGKSEWVSVPTVVE